jgi:excinuclease ABC subunit A
VKKDAVDEVADAILALEEETRLQVIFPVQSSIGRTAEPEKKAGRRKKASVEASRLPSDLLKSRLLDLRTRGFNRLYQDGQIFEFSTPESLLDVNHSARVDLRSSGGGRGCPSWTVETADNRAK